MNTGLNILKINPIDPTVAPREIKNSCPEQTGSHTVFIQVPLRSCSQYSSNFSIWQETLHCTKAHHSHFMAQQNSSPLTKRAFNGLRVTVRSFTHYCDLTKCYTVGLFKTKAKRRYLPAKRAERLWTRRSGLLRPKHTCIQGKHTHAHSALTPADDDLLWSFLLDCC